MSHMSHMQLHIRKPIKSFSCFGCPLITSDWLEEERCSTSPCVSAPRCSCTPFPIPGFAGCINTVAEELSKGQKQHNKAAQIDEQ